MLKWMVVFGAALFWSGSGVWAQGNPKPADQTQPSQTQEGSQSQPAGDDRDDLANMPPPQNNAREYVSKEGGFSLTIPAQWHEKVVLQPGVYQGFLSREEIGEAGRNFLVGISFLRINDYTRAFQFEAGEPGDIAFEFANRLAGTLGKELGGNGPTVIGLGTREAGKKTLFHYVIVAGANTEQCTNLNLYIGIWKKEMFYALFERPCSERDDYADPLDNMARSLVVQKKWTAKK